MDQEVTREGEEKVCSHGEDMCNCTQAAKHTEESHEEMALAFLLALMPLVALTFFGQVGLI